MLAIVSIIGGSLTGLKSICGGTLWLCDHCENNYHNRRENLRDLKNLTAYLTWLNGNYDLQWITGFEDFLIEMRQSQFEIDQRCPFYNLPNCWARYSNGKRIVKMQKTADKFETFVNGVIRAHVLNEMRNTGQCFSLSIQQQTRAIQEAIHQQTREMEQAIFSVTQVAKESIDQDTPVNHIEVSNRELANNAGKIIFSVDVGGANKRTRQLQNDWPILLPGNSTYLHLKQCSNCINVLQIRVESEESMEADISDDIVQLMNNGPLYKVVSIQGCGNPSTPYKLNQLFEYRFEKLEVVEISWCKNMKILFNHDVLRRLPNLKKIAAKNCRSLVKLISDESTSNPRIVSLQHIQILTLVELPNLESIYNGKVVWDSLNTINVLSCANLKTFPFPPSGKYTVNCDSNWEKSVISQSSVALRSMAPEQQLSRPTDNASSSSRTTGHTTGYDEVGVDYAIIGRRRFVVLDANLGNDEVEVECANTGTRALEVEDASLGYDEVGVEYTIIGRRRFVVLDDDLDTASNVTSSDEVEVEYANIEWGALEVQDANLGNDEVEVKYANIGTRGLEVQDANLGTRGLEVQDANLGNDEVEVEYANIGTRGLEVQDANLGNDEVEVEFANIGRRALEVQDANLGNDEVEVEDANLCTTPNIIRRGALEVQDANLGMEIAEKIEKDDVEVEDANGGQYVVNVEDANGGIAPMEHSDNEALGPSKSTGKEIAVEDTGDNSACLCIPFVENFQNRKGNLRTRKLQLTKLKLLEGNLEKRLMGNKISGDNFYKWWKEVQDFLYKGETWQFDDKVDQRSLRGCMPNCSARYSTGKQILKMLTKAEDLLEEFEKQSLSPLLLTKEKGRIRPCTRLIGVQAAEVVESIWNYLKEGNNANIIGVFGVAGSGKTSIVTQIHNRALEEKRNLALPGNINPSKTCFDDVFWVDVVSESKAIQSLQQSIAAELNMEPFYDAHHAEERAAKLSNALMKKGRYLLILDGMWNCENLTLEKIGIPEPTKENGSKIIIISRLAEVCTSLKTDQTVEVKQLSDYDSWALFLDQLGPDFIDVSSQVKIIAQHVAKECVPLPLAIITVARTLRNVTDRLHWVRTLVLLKESTSNVVKIEEKLFENLRFSYERLSDETSGGATQSCFLYCGLYPKNSHINTKELIQHWMWEGLLGDAGTTEDKMQRGQTVLEKLKAARLIEEVHQENGVEQITMHDSIWHMAIRISKTRSPFLIGSQVEERNSPDEWPRDIERVSLMRNGLQRFPNKPKCPKLHTLLLQYNYLLNSKLSDDFFTEMPLLRVLNLSYTNIHSLPHLSKLKNLRALLVSCCWKLKRLPSLKGLGALWVLDLSYTGIKQLPNGIKELSNLRRLDLSYSKVENFESSLLSDLIHLEELLMYGCDFFWGEACMEDLKSSQNLVVLEVNFSNQHVFDTYIKSEHCNRLQSFKFCVGEIYSRTLGNCGIAISKNFQVNGSPVSLPHQTTDLHLLRCEDISQLQMNYPLEHLKVVDISDCGNLKILFNGTVLRQLPNLEQIAIKRCQNLEKVIDEEGSSDDAGALFLPHLQTLTLLDLPKLKSIYDGVVVWNSLETIQVLMCYELKKIPSTRDVEKKIRGEEAWLRSLKWEDSIPQTPFEPEATAYEEQLSRPIARTPTSSSSDKTIDITTTAGKGVLEVEDANIDITPNLTRKDAVKFEYTNIVTTPDITRTEIVEEIVEETGMDVVEVEDANRGKDVVKVEDASRAKDAVEVEDTNIVTTPDITRTEIMEEIVEETGKAVVDVEDANRGKAVVDVEDANRGKAVVDVEDANRGKDVVEVKDANKGKDVAEVQDASRGTVTLESGRGE